MVWIVAVSIMLAVLMIFISTLTVKPGCLDEDAWIKVKIRREQDVMASWCRVKPGHGIKFYTLDGTPIDHSKERVAVIEPCLESNVNHPIPQEDINDLMNGHLSDNWIRKSYPFGRR